MTTPLGKIFRKFRIDHDLLLSDMANALGVSRAFLSAVETGRKAAPSNLVETAAHYMNLDALGRQELLQAAADSVRFSKVDLASDEPARGAALAFARHFATLSKADADAIVRILEK